MNFTNFLCRILPDRFMVFFQLEMISVASDRSSCRTTGNPFVITFLIGNFAKTLRKKTAKIFPTRKIQRNRHLFSFFRAQFVPFTILTNRRITTQFLYELKQIRRWPVKFELSKMWRIIYGKVIIMSVIRRMPARFF